MKSVGGGASSTCFFLMDHSSRALKSFHGRSTMVLSIGTLPLTLDAQERLDLLPGDGQHLLALLGGVVAGDLDELVPVRMTCPLPSPSTARPAAAAVTGPFATARRRHSGGHDSTQRRPYMLSMRFHCDSPFQVYVGLDDQLVGRLHERLFELDDLPHAGHLDGLRDLGELHGLGRLGPVLHDGGLDDREVAVVVQHQVLVQGDLERCCCGRPACWTRRRR